MSLKKGEDNSGDIWAHSATSAILQSELFSELETTSNLRHLGVISSQARLRPPNARRCRTICHRSCTVLLHQKRIAVSPLSRCG